MPFSPVHIAKIASLAVRRAHALVSGFHRRRARLFDDELILRDPRAAAGDAACALIAGEPLPVLAALVAGTHASPNRRGRFALACAALELPASAEPDAEQRRGSVALCVADAAVRFMLLRELLAPDGLLCVRADGAARALAVLLLDALYGATQRVALDAPGDAPPPLVYRVAVPVERAALAESEALAARNAAALRGSAVPSAAAIDRGAPLSPLERVLGTLAADACVVLDGNFDALAALDAGARRWFACGADPFALLALRKRLAQQRGRAVLCQQLRLGPGRGRHTAREMAMLALTLFGAEPLPLRRARSAAALGRAGDTFVFVDAPGAVTTQRTIDWALAQRARTGLAHGATVVLGWRYAADVALRWQARREPGLELRAIPAALQPRLAHGADLRAWRNTTAFPGLGQPLMATLERERDGTDERLIVVLRDYLLCAPAPAGLGLIELWSIDPDFDGVLFRAAWQCARREGSETVDAAAELTLPWRARTRRVALRLIDVHGQRTEVVHDIAAPGALQVREKAAAYAVAVLVAA